MTDNTNLAFADADQWIIKDQSKGMNDSQRTGKNTFRGTPSVSGQFDFLCAYRPKLAWRKMEFNAVRLAVEMEWAVQNEDAKFEDLWATNGAKWVVERNGVAIDTLAAGERRYTDTHFVYGQNNVYRVYLVSQELFYDKADNPEVLVDNVHCDGVPTLNISQSGTVGNVKIKVDMPNAQGLNGCTVALYKVVDDGTGQVVIPTPGTDQQPLQTQVFRTDGRSENNYVQLSFTDEEAAAPCHVWRYKVMCYGFTSGPFQGKTLESNVVDVIAQNNVQVTRFTAAKGESTDRVRLEWQTTADKTWRNLRYELARHPVNANDTIAQVLQDSEGWRVVYNAVNENSVNTYTDDVLPGYVYVYRLRAFPPCDGSYARDVFVEKTDIGYAASRGTIMGSVKYGSANTAVRGVDVRLTPDNNSLEETGAAYALSFVDDNDVLPLAPGLTDKFWKGSWTVQLLVRPQDNKQQSHLLTVPGRVQVDILDGDLLLAGKTMTLPNRQGYNAVMLSHDSKDDRVRLGYALNPGVNADVTSPVHWCIEVSDDSLSAWMQAHYLSPIQGQTETIDPALADKYDAPEQMLWIGSAHNGTALPAFSGYIDEVRLWSAALTETELANTYDRYLSGNEQKLAAYYTFDAGVAEIAFDNSHPGGKWNNRNVTLLRHGHPALEGNVLPSGTVLCYRSTTDENGEYQISGVPFMGEGTNYQVVPIYGTHEFQPASTRRYVSGQSLTHADVNFTDQSSFTVPVQAYYAFGNIPADSLYVCVDGVAQFDAQKKLIQTDAEGKATVSVPIGRHTITLTKSGRTLVAGGQPCTITGFSADGKPSYVLLSDDKDGKIDFQYDRTAPMTFYDETLVRVVGRVSGGVEEAGKPVGFHQGKGYLGQMVLKLKPNLPKEYFVNDGKQDLALNPGALKQDITVQSNTDSIATSTRYPLMASEVEVETDPTTGEYLALLPPVNWNVTSVKPKKEGAQSIFDLSQMVTSVYINIDKPQADTLWTDTTKYHNPAKTDTYTTFKYHAKRDFIHYTEPILTITNALAVLPEDSFMLGSDSISCYYTDLAKEEYVPEKVCVWRNGVPHDGTAASYALGVPVFGTNEKYKLRIRVSERYTNQDTGVEVDVPIKGAKLKINNRWASVYFKEATTGSGPYELLDTVQVVNDTTQEAGVVDYEFLGGIPNPSGDHILPMTITYTVNGADQVHTLNGVVLGTVSKPGSNFVTQGPNNVFFVLRDPPGTSSSAYLETGTTVYATRTHTGSFKHNLSSGLPTRSGTKAEQTVFTQPLGQAYKIITSTDINQTQTTTIKTSNETSMTYKSYSSYAFTQNISTSSARDYVGTDGDVYIGNSSNIIYSKADNINIRESENGELVSPSGHRYTLSVWQGLSRREEVGTVFNYTQKEIIDVQIPSLKKMRNDLVPQAHWVKDRTTMQGFAVPALEKRFNVYALEASRDKDVWEEGVDYVVAFPSAEIKDGVVQDSVTLYNSWIDGWEQCIANEEKFKLKVYEKKESYDVHPSVSTDVKYGYYGNTSFSAGTSVKQTYKFSNDESYDSFFSTLETHEYNFKTSYKVENIKNSESGTTFMNSTGAYYKESGVAGGGNNGGFGYTLSDPDKGDHFSVDVWMPYQQSQAVGIDVRKGHIALEPYVFRLVAGQSQNPWEKPQMTHYYKVNGQSVALDGGTESLDVPHIQFEKNRLVGVPSGTTATIKVRMANQSTVAASGAKVRYTLRCTNNFKGLIIALNGEPLDGGNVSILLPPDTEKEYVLTLKQSQIDVTDYEGLTFVLSSGGTPGNVAKDSISVSFAPAAPQIAMRATDGYVVNAQRQNARLPFQLSGYNADFFAFTGVRMQYKAESEQEWHLQKLLINDRKRYEDFRGSLSGEPWQELAAGSDTVTIDFTLLPEGRYQVRAQSFSILSNTQELTFETEPLTIIKDTRAPELFGTPLPADGYYAPGKEISVTFNEPLNEAAITSDNFYVTAQLNDAEVTHKTGLHFEGDTPARTSARVEMLNDDSALGLWFKPVPGRRSCLLSQRVTGVGGAETAFKLYYNADSTFTLQLGDTSITSRRKALGGDDWMYIAMNNNVDRREVELYCLYGTSTKTESSFIVANLGKTWTITSSNAPLYVGGSADHDPCYAEMEGLVIYDETRTFENIAREKGSKHSANVRGLMAYWPMDEGTGLVAADKVRQRNLTLQGTNNWYMPVTNYAMTFDAEHEQHVELMTDQFAIGQNDDYVVEFLFRTEGKQDGMVTLLSNGFGGRMDANGQQQDGIESESTARERFSVSLNPEGSIVLCGGAHTFDPMGSGYNDGQWHHFALNVQRDGYVSVMVDTLDISNDEHVFGSDFAPLSNARVVLGARRQLEKVQGVYQFDRHFTGQIDEVRIWSAFRAAKAVKSMAYARLDGDEPGLVAYYPFERTDLVANQEKTTPTLADRFKGNAVTGQMTARQPILVGYPQLTDSAALAAAVTTDKGMAIRAAGFMSRVSVKYVFDQTTKNRISLSFPDELDKARIEGCTVNFAVQNLKDMNGNLQTQPVRWEVLVNQKAINAVFLGDDLRQEIGTTTHTQLMIVNATASAQSYTIDGVPEWAQLSSTSGTIPANSYVTLDFNTTSGTGIGRYSEMIYVSGDDGLQNALPLTLTVTGKQPGWTVVDNGSDEWMALLGQLKIKDAWSTSESDIVAAFDAEGNCHGIASPTYSPEMDAYFLHIDLVGGMPQGNDELTFKVWESATGMTYSRVSLTTDKNKTQDVLHFADKKFVGNFQNPCIINALPINEQRVELQKGWNWVSLYVRPTQQNAREVFQVGRGPVDDLKQWQHERRQKSTLFRSAESYHVHATEPCTLVIVGEPVDPRDVEIAFNYNAQGNGTSWTWLGFPISTTLTVEQAFADFYPASGDIVKSASSYAVFNGKSWIGKLRYLSPGEGYHYGYNGLSNAAWHYPYADPERAAERATARIPLRAEEDLYHFNLSVEPTDYEDYTATQVVVIAEDGRSYGAPIELAAFSQDGKCRGVIDLEPGQTGPMAIFGEPGEEFSFRLWDKEQQVELPLWGTKAYDETTPCQSVTLYVSIDGIHAATATDSDSKAAYDTQGRHYNDPAHRRGVFVQKGKKQTYK